MAIRTCNEIIYPTGLYGSFNGSPCGRPVKEDGKCGIHCRSAKEKRQKKWDEKFEAKQKQRKEREIENAIYLLERNGYTVIKAR